MQITAKMVDFKIDHAKIAKAKDRMERRSMMKQLAFIRTRARSSIRKRKKPSEPGSPPSTHAPSSGRSIKRIFFVLDQVGEHYGGSVGPVKLSDVPFVKNDATVPNTIEAGGRFTLAEEEVVVSARAARNMKLPDRAQVDGDGNVRFWRQIRKRSKPKRDRRRRQRRITVRPRPFMMPALEAEIAAGTIMAPWQDSFHD